MTKDMLGPPAGDEVERLVESITDQIGYIDEVGQLAALARNRPQREEQDWTSVVWAAAKTTGADKRLSLHDLRAMHTFIKNTLAGRQIPGCSCAGPDAHDDDCALLNPPQREERLPEDVEGLRIEAKQGFGAIGDVPPQDQWKAVDAIDTLARRCAEAEAKVAELEADRERLLMDRARCHAARAVFVRALARRTQVDEGDWARLVLVQADDAALHVRREDLSVAQVSDAARKADRDG